MTRLETPARTTCARSAASCGPPPTSSTRSFGRRWHSIAQAPRSAGRALRSRRTSRRSRARSLPSSPSSCAQAPDRVRGRTRSASVSTALGITVIRSAPCRARDLLAQALADGRDRFACRSAKVSSARAVGSARCLRASCHDRRRRLPRARAPRRRPEARVAARPTAPAARSAPASAHAACRAATCSTQLVDPPRGGAISSQV